MEDGRPLIEAHKSEYRNGRGKVDTKGIEPDYIGMIGYAAVSEDQKIEKSGNFEKIPWQIPVYQKDKQFWEETGTIDHKTQVVVIDQILELSGSKYSSSAKYKGYLQVLRLDTGDCFYLNVTNFVVSPYWEKTLSSAIEAGYCIAAFKQSSDYYPVTKGNEKCELEDGTLVLLPMKSAVYANSPDKENNPILGIIFKEWKYGYGGVNVFFNEKDLTVTY